MIFPISKSIEQIETNSLIRRMRLVGVSDFGFLNRKRTILKDENITHCQICKDLELHKTCDICPFNRKLNKKGSKAK